MLAAFKLRAVPINVNYRYVEDELRYLLDDADAKAVVFHREFAPKLAAIARRAPAAHDLPRRRRRRRARPSTGSTRSTTRRRSAASSPARDFAAALRRRPLHPLHGRHDRDAEGRDVARTRTSSSARWAAGTSATRRSPRPEEIADALDARRRAACPACPFMHGTAHWMAFGTLFARRHGRHLARPPLRPRSALGARRARAGQLPRDRRRRVRAPARRGARRARPVARPVVAHGRAVGRRDPLARR